LPIHHPQPATRLPTTYKPTATAFFINYPAIYNVMEWHSSSIDNVLKELKTQKEGLTKEEADA